MKKTIITLFLILLVTGYARAQIKYGDYFENATLRIDYSHSGTSSTAMMFLEQLKKEPYWGGSKTNLIDKFEYGQYRVEVYDSASEKLIYSKDYATLFQEWQTTEEAKVIPRSFYETVVVPFPKNVIKLSLEGRDRKNVFHKQMEIYINPESYFINPEVAKYPYKKFIDNGDPSKKIDVVFIPDGYTQNEMEKFASDAQKFSGYLTKYEPFKEYASSFNFWHVDAPSEESGTDIPGNRVYKRTLLNSSFYTFNSERYIMTYDVKSVRDVAGEVPYDVIVILANSSKYGGGAVYNYYSLFTADDPYAEMTMVHEFGHLFAGLADEYVEIGSATEDMYDLTVEPPDPNITTLVNFEKKWKNLITEGVPIPTPNDMEYRDKVGAFEGAGYVPKGIYRPQYDCLMRSFNGKKFCVVCYKVITDMIKFYTE